MHRICRLSGATEPDQSTASASSRTVLPLAQTGLLTMLGTVWSLALVTLAFVSVSPAAAQTPLGSDFQLNTYTTGTQRYARVSVRPDRSFVAVWTSRGSDGTDTDLDSIRGALFDVVGNPIGGEFQVNTYTTGIQQSPEVDNDAAGNFIVVWDGFERGLALARRYDATGAPIGDEFLLNEATTYGGRPKISMRSDGTFVVAYAGTGSIMARQFDSAGVPVTGEIAVETYVTTESRFNPHVATNEDGEFVVTWTSRGSPGNDNLPGDFSIQGRLFDNTSSAVGAQFQVNSYTTDYQFESRVGMDATGAFKVVWQSSAGDNSGSSIRARRFNTVGTPIGPDFQVNNYTTGNQALPGLDVLDDGRFAVVWSSQGSAGTDTASGSIQMRTFSDGGTADGPQFQINSYTTGNQEYATISRLDDTNFVVVWGSNYGSAGNDNNLWSVQARIYGTAPPTTSTTMSPTSTTTTTTTTTLATVCDSVPDSGCFAAGAGGSSLQIKVDAAKVGKDKLKWKWGKGDAVAGADFQDPDLVGRAIALCVYDASGSGQPIFEGGLKAGGSCDGKPCWKGDATKGYGYKDKAGTPDGVAKAKLKPGDAGKAQVQVQAKGVNFTAPTLGLTLPVTAQLVIDGTTRQCWQAVFSEASKNDAGQFTAKGPAGM